MALKTELIIALDFPKAEPALTLMKECADLSVIWKVGSELFLAEGAAWVKSRVKEGHRIFLDLKFHDIPNTVLKAAVQVQDMGVEMFTLHLSGGPVMIRAVRDELENHADCSNSRQSVILGVSVLTSFDEKTWDEVSFKIGGTASRVEESVMRLVEGAHQWGVDGVVCSPHELQTVKRVDAKLYTVVPGIRFEGAEVGDQARVMTPKEAAALGADAIVVGRPITMSLNPRATVEKILKELDTPIGKPLKEV